MAEPVYTPDFSAIREGFSETWALGTEWLIPLAMAIVLMGFITRDVEKWKIMFFPIVVIEWIIGMPVHFLIMVFASILFITETLSTQIVGALISPVRKYLSSESSQLSRKEEKQYKKASKLLERAKVQENYESTIGSAKLKGLTPTGITELINKSSTNRGY